MKRAIRITLWSILGIILLLAAVVGWRYTGAAAAVTAYEQAAPVVLGDIGVTEHLTILPIFENATRDQALNTGHGVAYLIHTDATSILMDAGFNPDNLDPSPLAQNMARSPFWRPMG